MVCSHVNNLEQAPIIASQSGGKGVTYDPAWGEPQLEVEIWQIV